MPPFILFAILFLLIKTQLNESQRLRLGQSLMELIANKKSDYLNAPTKISIHNADRSKNYHYKYLFDYMKESEIEDIKNRYGFSEKVAQEIKSTRENWITQVIDDSQMDVPKFTDEKYVVFKLSFASSLKENDIIYFVYLEISFHGNIDYNCFKRDEKQEQCSFDYCGFKHCEEKKVINPLEHTQIQKDAIISEAYYKIFDSLIENPFMGDQTIQLYYSNGNAIFSDDGEFAAYVGEFGDIAIGPKKYLNSIQPLKKYYVYCGSNTYSEFSDIICDDYCFGGNYPGQMVHKFSMVLGKINPTSSVYTHRQQMRNGESKGPYSLVLYSNGELTLFNNSDYTIKSKYKNIKTNIIWTSNTKGKGVAPYKIKLSKDLRLQVLDANNVIIYKSKEYINIPTLKYKSNSHSYVCNYPYIYNGYNNTLNDIYFQIGISDESYPGLQLDVYYMDGNRRWIKTKKQFTDIHKPTIHETGAKALKMMLTGPGSERFKVCYQITSYLFRRNPNEIKFPLVCDGTVIELDKNRPEMISTILAFITLKTDSNPQ